MQTDILNATAELGNLELLANQVVEGFIIGLHKSPFHGFSAEFAEHRIYNLGESTKHIDWKVLARTEKTFVKRYEEETNLRAQIIIDASSSMYYPEQKANSGKLNKIGFSILSSAVLLNVLKRQRDAFGITVFNDKIDFQSESRSTTTHQKLLLNYLFKIRNKKSDGIKTEVTNCLHAVADKIHRRSLVIIFSDMFENLIGDESGLNKLWGALQHLKHNKHEVILFHVTDVQTELEFNFENRPYKFIDLENGVELKLQPNEVKSVYNQKMNAFYEELKLKCGQYKIDLVQADVSKGFDQILVPYFVKRAKMM